MTQPKAYGLQQRKISSRYRWLYLVFMLALGIGSLWYATQRVAMAYSFNPALGVPWFQCAKMLWYAPWAIFGWQSAFGDPHGVIEQSITYGQAIFLVPQFVILAAYLGSLRWLRGNKSLHGSARWATRKEIQKMGYLDGKGVYIGGYVAPGSQTQDYLRHDGPEHVMAFAPTRSGKGVGLILPTLLSWPGSVLVLDIKGENWALTAGWRRKNGSHVLKLEPTATDGSSVHFNPLEEIRLRTIQEVADVQNIVTMIVDPDGKGLNDHWAKTGHALLTGAVLHVLYAEADKTLSGVAKFLSDPSRTLMDTLQHMLHTEHDPTHKQGWTDGEGQPSGTHPVVAASSRDMLNKSENERSGVLSTAMSFLTLYRDEVIARNTARSEFKIRDLMHADRPVSLYLVVPPSDKDRLKPLLRLIINQIVRTLSEKMEFKDGRSVAGYKHRLLLLIDEFPSLGKLDIFSEALAYIAGYGMKAYLIIQDIAQLWSAYGKEESIFSNCHVRIAYAPNKIETANLLSDMTGKTTVVERKKSISGKAGNRSETISIAETARPLLTPDECGRLPGMEKDALGRMVPGDMLIFTAGNNPIYGRQILYFNDPEFLARAKIPAPARSDSLLSPEPEAQPLEHPVPVGKTFEDFLEEI